MSTIDTPNTQSEFAALKERLRDTWASGNYTKFATYMEPGAVAQLDAWNVKPGERFLDVACGSGQLAIPAARMGVVATGIDISEPWIQGARRRAATEGLDCVFDVGDAENLPYEDGSFDVVASIFGAMFAPRPERVAAELMRVVRPGGRILMGNWGPDCLPADIFRAISNYIPAPPNMEPPSKWGIDEVVRERFAGCAEITTAPTLVTAWRYPMSVPEVVDLWFENYGPMVRARLVLKPEDMKSLRDDMIDIFHRYNRGASGITLLEGKYLNVQITR